MGSQTTTPEASPGKTGLLEREAELEALREATASAREGAGRLLVVQGQAGIGKTRLLEEGALVARKAGLRVLTARGSELERDFPFGVALQLFEPVIGSASDERRAALLEGAAALAAPLFEPGGRLGQTGDEDDAAFPLLHGLLWLTSNLAEEAPVSLLVDDVQWADAPTLRFLLYAAQRVDELAVTLVLATRSGEAGTDPLLAGELRSHPLARNLPLGPLSADATSSLVDRAYPDADQAFRTACHDVTGGNPFLVRELLKELRERGSPADRQTADRVGRIAPQSVSLAVLAQIARLPHPSSKLARAVAVLGDGSDLRVAAELAGVELEDAARMADALSAAEILAPGMPLRFVHPLLRTAVYEDVPPAERASAHGMAARLLRAQEAAQERVASHLLLAHPSGDRQAVESLRTAARLAADRGAPDSAAALLRRALEEPPPAEARAELLIELGRAESAAGEPGFGRRLEEAVELLDDPTRRAETLFLLGRRLTATGSFRDAAQAFDRGLEAIDGTDETLRIQLEAGFIAAARLDVSTRPRAIERLGDLQRRGSRGSSPMERVLNGTLAFDMAALGAPREEVAALARRALEGGLLLADATCDGMAFISACAALGYADELEEGERQLGAGIDHARRRGSLPLFARASLFRAFARYRLGRLADAMADAASALDAGRFGVDAGGPGTNAILAESLIDAGRPEEAADALDLPEVEERWSGSAPYGYFLAARGRLALEHGDPQAALADYRACGDLLTGLQARNPTLIAWRSGAALAAARLGEAGEAARLTQEELELARAFGAPRALGIALRTAGLLAERRQALELLEEAVRTLAPSPSRLEHARALTDLGAALRRGGRPTDAREPLRLALDLAHRCGAEPLAERAREELVAAGGRPRRRQLTGREALTSSERRVARMAAEGLTNRQIAESLFLSLKTVQFHLGNAYRKLEISSRGELGSVLGDADDGA